MSQTPTPALPKPSKAERQVMRVFRENPRTYFSPAALAKKMGMGLGSLSDLLHDLKLDQLVGPMPGMSEDCRYIQLTELGQRVSATYD